MRDRDHGARELRRQLLELRPPVGVQMRLRLVEQEQVRLADQAGGQRDELALPARERGGRQPEVVLVEARARAAGCAPRPPARGRPTATQRSSSALLAREHAIHLARGRRSPRGGRALPRPRAARASSAATSGRAASTVASAVAVVAVGVLLEVGGRPGPCAAPPRRRSAVSSPARIFSIVDFPAPFGPDDPDPRALPHLQVGALEHRPGAEGLLDADQARRAGHGAGRAAFSSADDGRRTRRASHRSRSALTRGPLPVEHREPGRVAVAALDDHVLAEDALEREARAAARPRGSARSARRTSTRRAGGPSSSNASRSIR